MLGEIQARLGFGPFRISRSSGSVAEVVKKSISQAVKVVVDKRNV